ncbi:phage tail P2-like protein [Variovorax sp. OAS795]|uniref:phage tail protein I n=1 Tax=Variovorax sp. OAS795 TaxID=3034231 RepID=UPI00339AB4B0
MSDARLLPPNRTALESAIASVSALMLDTSGLRHLWSARQCLPAALPWLSWALTVEGWSDARSDDARRAVILDSINIHRHKGTPWAIRALIRAIGFGEVTIIERVGGRTHNGAINRNGEFPHASLAATWATYKIVLERPITNVQAERLRKLLPAVAPARCHLVGLRYASVANSHNGATRRDGAYNHGSA